MAVYTCYDMVADCRADKREGWVYLVTEYIPACREFLARYFPGRASDSALPGRVLQAVCRPDSPLFDKQGPVSEREFVADLRQSVLAAVEMDRASDAAEVPLDLETLAQAWESLTATERQAVWMEGMNYEDEDAARILRMESKTVSAVRERASEMLRQSMDRWSADLIAANGGAIGRLAAAARTPDCIPARSFLDLLDGKMTWARRQDIELHMTRCWHCVDHLSRLREVDEVLRLNKRLSTEEAAPFLQLLNVADARKAPFWKRMLAR